MFTGSDTEGCGGLETTEKRTSEAKEEEEEESRCARALEAGR